MRCERPLILFFVFTIFHIVKFHSQLCRMRFMQQLRGSSFRGFNHMEWFSLRSYAKINLGLLLLGKRDDGYHDIATVFQQIDLHDHISFRKIASSIRITSSNPTLPLDENNLVYKSCRLFQKAQGITEGLEVHIQKHIPIGGGLGGGSSNAAATLVAMNHLWKTNLSLAELLEMAIKIGSDVPFFLQGGIALGRGRGEILTPIQWPADWWIVLICPGIHVSSSWAYRQAKIALTKEEKFTKFRSIFKRYSPHTLRTMLINELEGVVFQRHPILQEIKKQLYQRDAFYASMSGSGSSVYGLFSHRAQAEVAKASFCTDQGMETYLCRPISS